MSISRTIAGAYIKLHRQGQAPIYDLWINGANKGTFQLDNMQGVLALIEVVLKTDPKQKEMRV